MLDAVEARQHDVHDDKIWVLVIKGFQSFDAVFCLRGGVAGIAEHD